MALEEEEKSTGSNELLPYSDDESKEDGDDENDDGNHHSLPLPLEIEAHQQRKTNKTLQTIAGVAGNILEW